MSFLMIGVMFNRVFKSVASFEDIYFCAASRVEVSFEKTRPSIKEST
jgi:hypothetical protein